MTNRELRLGIKDGDPDAPAGVDYFTLAEDYDVDDVDVGAALANLHVTSELEVRYAADPGRRPIIVHVWTEPERVREEVDEAHEVRAAPPAAEPTLRESTSVVAVELGCSMLEDMGVVFA